MTPSPSILLIDSDESDRALATLLLQREIPSATVTAPIDASALAAALATHTPDVAIVAADLTWRSADTLVTAIKRGSPASAVVLFGHESDILAHGLNPGMACDGIVRKGSAGFLGLPAIVTEILERARRAAAAAVTAVQESKAGERSHQEMRDIALVFSHDLQEPLQQIVRLARIGQASADERVSARSLQRVLECAGRASSMLEGMLEYLAVAARDAAPIPIDLNGCLTKALDNLRGADGSTFYVLLPQTSPHDA